APHRRLPLRQQDGLRLLALFLPLRGLPDHRASLRFGTRTRRCRRVPPSRHGGRLHQAADRPAGRCPAYEGGAALAERRTGAAGSRRHLRGDQGAAGFAGQHAALCQRPRRHRRHLRQGALHRNPAERRAPRCPQHCQRAGRRHADLHRARWALLLHGRQPRQQPGQPLRGELRWGGNAAGRIPHRPGRPDHVLLRRPLALLLLDLAVRPLLHGGGVRLSADLRAFAARSGQEFRRPELLRRAVTHSSIATPARPDNQRLEFLGDRVLGLVMAEALLAADRGASEGQLAPRFNALVRKETCAAVARETDLGEVLKLGRSEMMSGGRRKEALLADAMEAVIAAVYLDAGFETAKAVVLRLWDARIGTVKADARDAKTALQEWAQGRGLPPPAYSELEREGPDHQPMFTVEVRLATGEAEVAQAGAKRQAEQAAAKALLARMERSSL